MCATARCAARVDDEEDRDPLTTTTRCVAPRRILAAP